VGLSISGADEFVNAVAEGDQAEEVALFFGCQG
jgi:hypothetical protein